MHIIRKGLVFLLLAIGLFAHAQTPTDAKQPRILILLDGSSSMGNKWIGNERRFDAAARIITTLIDSLYKVNKDVEFALRVYGHQYPAQQNNCYDTRMEVMFSKDNLTQMSLRLAALRPIGVSPIAFSLKEAAENDMVDPQRNTYSLILVTDGSESCGGNICEVVQKLLSLKIDFKPYILSLVDEAPIKAQYDCLGNYLLVSKEEELKPAVGKIVSAYQQMFVMQRIDKKLLQSAVINTPSVLKVDIPKFKVTKEVDEPAPAVTTAPVQEAPPTPKPQVNRPPVKEPEVLKPTPTKDLTNRTNESFNPKPVAVQRIITKDELTAIQLTQFGRSFPIRYSTPQLQPRNTPEFKVVKIEEEPKTATPQVVSTPVVKQPAPTPKPQPKPAVATTPPPAKTQEMKSIKQESVDNVNKESTLTIYFTNAGKTKYYESSPEIVLYDPKTKKAVHRFNRSVGSNGKPTPQRIPAGTYNLKITGKDNLTWTDIVIEEGKDNAQMLVVGKASISFQYEGNSRKPVEGYIATIVKRFDVAPIVSQKTTEELEYEPGTYLAEINTLPPSRKSFDLDFGTSHGITILEEGELVLDNSKPLGKVNLYYPWGDQFRLFYTANLDGSGNPIKLKILRGFYRAGFKKNPNQPYAEETLTDFTITSNNVTNLELQ